MAVLFPLRLDGKRFFVNPTKIQVQKRSQISEVRTMAGTTFQAWPDLPDEVKFSGISFGIRSLFELRNMAAAMEKNAERKQIDMIYKFQKYKGFLKDLSVGAVADKPRQFEYSFTFLVKEPRFRVADMTFGQLIGVKAEFDFIESQLRGASSAITNIPSDLRANVLNVSNSIGRIGLNIGRSR